MKKLLITLTILLLAAPVWATTYYGCAAQEITAADTFKVDSACTGASLTWASLANGDVLDANGRTISIANDIGASDKQVTLRTSAAGGGFTFDVNAVAKKTLYTHITADTTGTTQVLAISGAGGGSANCTTDCTEELIINGNITGGTTSLDYGVADSSTLSKITVNGNITGGTNATAYGYYKYGSSGIVVITGNATGAKAHGINVEVVGGAATITGNCIGSDTSLYYGVGCYSSGGVITIIGNIISQTYSSGSQGRIIWQPVAPSSGVTGNYIVFNGGGTPVYAGTNTDDVTKALTTFYYIDPTDGTSDQGTASTSGSGGGAWGF